MPYIKEARREAATDAPVNVGELTFAITSKCLDYLLSVPVQPPDFQAHAEIVAALECAKLEFYRRALGYLEDGKLASNGDVGYEELFPKPKTEDA